MAVTDLELWQETAVTQQPKWENRAKIISHFIRPSDSILDLGAGDRKLQKYIPSSCQYIPVDCTDALPGTCVVDFNEKFELPAEEFNVVISAGFMEYLSDIDSFMKDLATECNGKYFIFTYSYTKNKLSNKTKTGKRYKKLNSMSDPEEVIGYFGNYVNNLYEIVRLTNQSLFSGVLSENAQPSTQNKITMNEAIRRKSFWQKIL